MVEGLEVTIKYRGAKYNQVASPATASSEFAILKKDLAHLRVHSPSQKNVRRVNGSFVLHWPAAGTSPKLDGLADSLHTRWFKLCSDDPEALKLREFLSIDSITLTQDGVLIRSTPQRDQVPHNALLERSNDSSSGPAQQPALTSVPTHPLPTKPSVPLPPPPRVPPIAPRSDRQLLPHLKRRMSSLEGPSATPIRQKLDIPDTQSMSPGPRSTNLAQPTRTPASPKTDLLQSRSTTPKDVSKPSPQSAREDGPPTQLPHPVMPPPRDSGETTPRVPLPVTTPVSASGPSTTTLGWGSAPPPPPSPVTLSGPAPAPVPVSVPASTSPTMAVAASIPPESNPNPNADVVTQLMRQLVDTRNALAAGQKREQALLDQLERLGAPPAGTYLGGGGGNDDGGCGKGDRNDAEAALRDEVSRLENEVKAERVRRMRAERALSDVEKECRAPFIVPALYQAFISISELTN